MDGGWRDGGEKGENDCGGLEEEGGKRVKRRTEEETFPDFEEVGLCEVAAGC